MANNIKKYNTVIKKYSFKEVRGLIKNGDITTLFSALNNLSFDLSYTDHLGNTLLHYAIADTLVVGALVAKMEGLSLKAQQDFLGTKNIKGDTALHLAVQKRYEDVATMLIKLYVSKGISLDIKNIDDDTPLLLAAYSGNHKLAKLLIYHGADVNIPNDDGKSYYQVLSERPPMKGDYVSLGDVVDISVMAFKKLDAEHKQLDIKNSAEARKVITDMMDRLAAVDALDVFKDLVNKYQPKDERPGTQGGDDISTGDKPKI